MDFKKTLIFIMFLTISSSSLATVISAPKYTPKGDFRCYAGTLSNPEVKDVTQVRIALKPSRNEVSTIIFFTDKSHYASDMFCDQRRPRRCGIVDDRGSLEILSLTNQNMIIRFNGKPGIAAINGSEKSPGPGTEIFPTIDVKAKLTTPIRMILRLRPKSDCE